MKKAIENIFTFVSIREIPPHTSLFYPPGISFCLYMNWQLAAHADEIESQRRVPLSSFGLFRKRCSRLFSNYKSKTLMRASPLLSTTSLSPCPSGIIQSVSHGSSEEIFPNSKSNWNWKMEMKMKARRGGDVPKVLSMQMTGQTTCRYNGNNNSHNNNNNSNVVIFTGTHTHTLRLGHRASLYVGVSCALRKRTVKVRAMRFDPKENWSRIQNPNPTTTTTTRVQLVAKAKGKGEDSHLFLVFFRLLLHVRSACTFST